MPATISPSRKRRCLALSSGSLSHYRKGYVRPMSSNRSMSCAWSMPAFAPPCRSMPNPSRPTTAISRPQAKTVGRFRSSPRRSFRQIRELLTEEKVSEMLVSWLQTLRSEGKFISRRQLSSMIRESNRSDRGRRQTRSPLVEISARSFRRHVSLRCGPCSSTPPPVRFNRWFAVVWWLRSNASPVAAPKSAVCTPFHFGCSSRCGYYGPRSRIRH